MGDVRLDKHGRIDRTHLLTSTGNTKKDARVLSIYELRNLSKQERREMLLSEYIFKKKDEKERDRKLPKQYENKTIWVEITDEDQIEMLFGGIAPACMETKSDYRFFLKRNNILLCNVDQLEIDKKKLIKDNESNFSNYLRKNPSLSWEWVETRTFYEIQQIVDANFSKNNK